MPRQLLSFHMPVTRHYRRCVTIAFHAAATAPSPPRNAGREVRIDIRTLDVIDGSLPRRALALVRLSGRRHIAPN